MIVSHAVFIGFVTVMLGGTAIGWTIVEVIRLRRALRADPRDPPVVDRIFGGIVGLVIAVLAAVGVFRYHL